MGTHEVQDGTYTNAIRCGSQPGPYACSGWAGFNSVTHYYVKTDDGMWILITFDQAVDSSARHDGLDTPVWREKSPFLEQMKPGGELLFRVKYWKKQTDVEKLFGSHTDVYIPRADNPAKEDKFIGIFVPKVAPPPVPAQPTDNIKALCDSHKLSPELEAQYCKPDAGAVPKVLDVDANLKEVCKSGKLSPEWQAQYCKPDVPKMKQELPDKELK